MESYEAFSVRREVKIENAVVSSIVDTIFCKLANAESLANLLYDWDIPEDFAEGVAGEFDRIYQQWNDEEC